LFSVHTFLCSEAKKPLDLKFSLKHKSDICPLSSTLHLVPFFPVTGPHFLVS
jgi:hypothetical protein